MNILLDTHIAIWALNDEPLLSQKARELILDPDNVIYYSVVSTWEILLKHNKDKSNLELSPELFVAYCEEAGFVSLDLYDKHVLGVQELRRLDNAPPHNDPFDRLLLAQAKTENMCFVTHDNRISEYTEKCIIAV